jgi:predicted ribosome quality control (RQC) complex YloA/Tae2 family protein
MLDGMFLSFLKAEIAEKAIGARVEKVHQISKEELVFSLKGRGFSGKLLMSAKGNSPRVHFTDYPPENPEKPPMFCMLMRKYLVGGFLSNIRQDGFERVLFFDFDCTSEMGDRVTYTLAVEIMSRHSNIILIDSNKKVMDSIRRVDADLSSARLVLPGLIYEMPPKQDKLELTFENLDDIANRLLSGADKPLSKQLMTVISGISPVIAREISYCASNGDDLSAKDVNSKDKIKDAMEEILNRNRKPMLIVGDNDKAIDFTFININQYGSSVLNKEYQSYSNLLDAFYQRRAEQERSNQKSADVTKTVTSILNRITRKIEYQKEELKNCKDRDKLRIYGDLISANIYRINKGDTILECEDFYNNNEKIRIKLNPEKSASQNAQKYYKDYKKYVTAEKVLTEQIAKGLDEKEYLESVLDLLQRSRLSDEINGIKAELISMGYIRNQVGKKKSRIKGTLPPKEYTSSDGFKILVGRNNLQNDLLTLKQSEKSDLWFHTKDIHGSHTILKLGGAEPTETAIKESAEIAAFNSKGCDSQNVPVDYTYVKFVKKPSGAKAGKVIYTNQKTIYVTPNDENVEKLLKRN